MARLSVSEFGLWSLVGEVGREAWPGPEDEEDIGVTRGPGRRRREVTLSTAATSWTDMLTVPSRNTFHYLEQNNFRKGKNTAYLDSGEDLSHV